MPSKILDLCEVGVKWRGFRWRETGADAAMSMLWFDLWLSTGDRGYLEASIRYNEDDCRATKVVREWLVSARLGLVLRGLPGMVTDALGGII